MAEARPAGAIIGAEYCPLVAGAQRWIWNPLIDAWQRRRALQERITAGPHLSEGLPYERWEVADLADPDTALLVARRLCLLPSPPLAAYPLVQQLVSGRRWTLNQASQLGALCARAWGPQPALGVQIEVR